MSFTMSYWSTQYKHAEVARSQNKREERLLKLEIASKRGIKEAHRFNIQAVEHEQRLIEKELERIRKGLNKRPLQGGSSGNVSMLALFSRSHVSPRKSNRQENAHCNEKNAKETVEVLGKDSDLFKAIVTGETEQCIECVGANTTSRQEQILSRVHSEIAPEEARVTGCVVEESERRDYRGNNIDLSSRDSGNRAKSNTQIEVEFLNDLDSDRSISKSINHGSVTTSLVESDRSTRYKRRQPGVSLDLSQLASIDMKSVKSNVSKRLLVDSRRNDIGPNSTSARENPKKDVADMPEESAPVLEVKPREKLRKASRSKGPTADAHKKVIDFDPEQYNPDGSLRKIHTIPAFDQRWQQAQTARYIRTKEPTEQEKELSVEQIFGKKASPRQT